MPITAAKHEESLRRPALCELLPVREYLDGIMVQVDGSLVAGYELTGINGFYHDDHMRNRSKHALEALIRSLPERSMRLQMRFEICEGIGDVRAAYPQLSRNENPVLQAMDRDRMERWDTKERGGHYLRHLLVVPTGAYLTWNGQFIEGNHSELPQDPIFSAQGRNGWGVSRPAKGPRGRVGRWVGFGNTFAPGGAIRRRTKHGRA